MGMYQRAESTLEWQQLRPVGTYVLMHACIRIQFVVYIRGYMGMYLRRAKEV